MSNVYYGPAIPGSHWISTQSGDTSSGAEDGGHGYTTYTTTFQGSSSMSGLISFFADNSVTAALNGHSLGAGTSSISTPVSELLPLGDFVNGTNTLTFTVFNDSGPTGLDFAGTASTPEPSSLALLGTGVLGVLGTVRRRLRG